jgi:L-arabinose isomerase
MDTMTATREAPDRSRLTPALPRLGLLGIMQDLYDDMLPGIGDRQKAYAHDIGAALAGIADVHVVAPAKDRQSIESAVREFEGEEIDGLLVVMLTYGPAMRVARALAETRLPVCLLNVQPVPKITPDWNMSDLTYNQGIHGAQDTANAMVRAGRAFHVITDDWHLPSFERAVGQWARAAAAVSRWRKLKVAILGYAMNGMGDIRVDVHTLLRTLGPQIDAIAPGELHRAAAAVGAEAVASLMAAEDEQFEIDPRLSAVEREDHVRMQLGLEQILLEGGYGAYSTHFGAIAEDGRFSRLPLAAASSLMAKGYGFSAEGDGLTAALMSAAQILIGETQFTEMYAMDFSRDAFLMSHMGEGNWALAREDRPVKLIKRPLGIGGLGDPPTFLFQYRVGAATLATLVALGDERFRLLVSEGEVLDTDELPGLEMPYGFFKPDSGLQNCIDAWLRSGGPHHQVLNLGRRAAEWHLFGQAAGIEVVLV